MTGRYNPERAAALKGAEDALTRWPDDALLAAGSAARIRNSWGASLISEADAVRLVNEERSRRRLP